MLGIMSEEKKPEVDKIVLTSDTLRKYFPRTYTPKQMQDTIIKLAHKFFKSIGKEMGATLLLRPFQCGHKNLRIIGGSGARVGCNFLIFLPQQRKPRLHLRAELHIDAPPIGALVICHLQECRSADGRHRLALGFQMKCIAVEGGDPIVGEVGLKEIAFGFCVSNINFHILSFLISTSFLMWYG